MACSRNALLDSADRKRALSISQSLKVRACRCCALSSHTVLLAGGCFGLVVQRPSCCA